MVADAERQPQTRRVGRGETGARSATTVRRDDIVDEVTISALVTVAAVALAPIVLLQRARRRSRARLLRSLRDVAGRLAELVRALDAVLDRITSETKFGDTFAALVAAVDLPDALERTAAAAVELVGARGAAARARTAAGDVVAAVAGDVPDAPGMASMEWPFAGVRAVTFAPLDGGAGQAGAPVSGVAVPIGEGGREPVAVLVVFLEADAPPAERALRDLERLAATAAPVIAAALAAARSEDARAARLAQLPGRAPFHEQLERECARARRSGSPLALGVAELDATAPGRAVADDPDAAVTALASLAREVAPGGTLACRTGGLELALIMPGTPRGAAELALARLAARAHGVLDVELSTGVAELRPDDDPIGLLARARAALADARRLRAVRRPGAG